MDAPFSERWLGFCSFSDFRGSHGESVNHHESSTARIVWLRADSWHPNLASLDECGPGRANH
jgi:hypothetical protein